MLSAIVFDITIGDFVVCKILSRTYITKNGSHDTINPPTTFMEKKYAQIDIYELNFYSDNSFCILFCAFASNKILESKTSDFFILSKTYK